MPEPWPPDTRAKKWRTSCGSFVVNGHRGSANDYLLDMFLASSEPRRPVTEIRMSPDVFVSYGDALERQLGLPLAISRAVEYGGLPYFGARVTLAALPYGTAQFFVGEELVGETTGWTA